MNANRFRLIYSEVHGEYIPVAEMTESHLWTIPGISGSRIFPLQSGVLTRVLKGLIVGSVALSPGLAQTIITPDNRTQTTVATTGTVSAVTTTTIRSSNAFNSFSKFNVGAGDTVNLYLPTGTQNLVNIIRDQRTDIYGVLNAIKDGKIGGNVWFANPYGFLVGSTGVVNVGSLTVTTPTSTFVNDFFLAPNDPNDVLVSQLLAGTAPRSGSGLVSIQGKVNAIDGIQLSAGTINVGGALYSGAQFIGTTPEFTDVVNANGLASGTNIIANGGQIQIVADNDVAITAMQASGGTAEIQVASATIIGANVTLAATADYSNSTLLLPVQEVHATINIDSSHIEATGGDVVMTASSTVDVSTPHVLPMGIADITSQASVNVVGSSEIASTGAARLTATSSVTSEVLPGMPDFVKLPGDAGVAINRITSDATVHVGGSSQFDLGGELKLAAGNTVDVKSIADASASGSVAVGGTLALSQVTTLTQAYIDDQASVTDASAITIEAVSDNIVETSAKAATGGATKKGASASHTEETLAEYKDQASTTDGSVEVAAAVAIADVNSLTQAYLASSESLDATGAVVISSQAHDSSTVMADGSSAGGDVGVGAAVGLNMGVLTNAAFVGDDSQVTAQGLTISAVNTAGEGNTFTTTAKSGAGAGNVGVAGSLAANIVVNTTVAALEGDTDNDGTGASVNAGTGDILIEAGSASTSAVTSGADVKGTGDAAKVGVGASIGVNVGVNTTVAEVSDKAVLTGGNDFDLNATADHTLTTDVTGGAAGASVAVTPLVAATIAVNTTTARLGEGTGLNLSGTYRSTADHKGSATTTATGQTQGNSVAVGASIGLTVATDTVVAEIDRNVEADAGVEVNAASVAKSSTSATSSVAGGEKAKDDGSAPAAGGGSGSGESVDQKVAGQQTKATTAGQKTASKALATTPAAGSSASAKLQESQDNQEAPKTEETTQSGGVAVAAAVAVNTGVATTTATVGKGQQITSSGGALKVTSTNETDTGAKADGSQVDSGNTSVGVGAAVALNAGISTNVASVGDNAVVNTHGLTVSAVNATGEKSDSSAEAKSGAGAGNVGVAGSLAANIVVNTTVAALEGDSASDADTKGAAVNAGDGDILIEAANATTSTVKSGADVKGTDAAAKVGVGASIGMNVAVNTIVAEAGDKSEISNGKDFALNAKADHTLTTDVTGGAAGAQVAVTPLAAVTVAVNTTTGRLGASPVEATLSGQFSSTADHKSSATTTATGQTAGSKVAVGVSLGLTSAVDTVTADVERDIDATNGVEVEAMSTAKSSTTATASVSGGDKAKDDGSAPAPGGGSGSGESVDDKVAGQQNKATAAGKATAAKAPATTPAAGGSASSKLDTNKQTPPKGETSEGGVSVAAAVGVNVGVATTTARVGEGKRITSSTGAFKVRSVNETDTSAKADGSQVDSAKSTNVGIGAAVALNVGVATTTAVVADEAVVSTKGLTISAAGTTGEKSDSSVEAKSGAGAGNVGVAGSLAINSATNTTLAMLEGDADGDASTAQVDANGGAVLIEAQNATTSKAKVSADVKGTDDKAKVGVGASIGVNVGVNTTLAEVGDGALLIDTGGVGLHSTADHAMTTDVTGGAAGAKVSVTPVVAASIAVNTTAARLGNAATELDVAGAYSSKAEQTSTMTTKATGQAQGDVAVGASLGATIAVDNVSATIERDLDASNGIDLAASSDTSLTTEVKAGAKGAKAAKKDASGNETPEAGTTVDDQKKTQLDFAKSRNANAAGVSTATPEAKTPDTTEQAPSTDKPTNPPTNEKQGKKVSVAAAIGATVAYNQAKAEIASDKTVGAGTGKLKVASTTDTNYRTLATGEAVSDDIGVAAAVALTATYNKTQAHIGSGVTVSDAGDIDISATSRQNRGTNFQKTMSSEAVSGASGGEVAVAGSLAVVGNWNETRASIDEGATIGTSGAPVGDVTVTSDETSKVAAQARAGAISTGDKSKAGVGASFAVLLSYNQNTAAVGYDANKNGSFAPTSIFADSLSTKATKNRVWFLTPTLTDAKNFVANDIKNLNFDALDPSTYLGSNNYYTEAVAGAAAKGNAAVAGAFAVNLFGNTTEAYLGNSVNVTTYGKQQTGEQLGVEVAAHSDTQAVSFTGGVAGAKKAGVGISATSIVSLDQTLAAIGNDSVVKSNADGAGLKVTAYARQDIANIGVGAALATEGTGVTGVLGAIVSLAKTEAKIGEDAEVKSMGDIDVEANGDITAVSVSGGVAGGQSAGVGASIASNVLANATRAEIGDGAEITAKQNLKVAADADEVAITAVVAGAGGEKAGVAGALSANVILGSTEAVVGQGAQLNTDSAYDGAAQDVSITAHDDTIVVGIAGGGAGGGKAGVGAALDTTVLVKTVKASIEDDSDGANVAQVQADRNVLIDASATETITSVAMGFAGGGNAGVGGAVSVAVNTNDVQAGVGKSAMVDSDGNVLINAQDDITAVLVAGAGAGGGDAGVGGSLAVATLLGNTKAYVGDEAKVNARGHAEAATVYKGETVFTDTDTAPDGFLAKKTEAAKGLSVTAYNRENLITTVVGGAGGGTAGVAATVSANVIASKTEASIGQSARINENNASAGTEQEVRVKAVDETLLIDSAGAGAGGGTAGVGAAANVGVIAKTTTAKIGKSALVNATHAVELDAASSEISVTTSLGLAGGGSAGVGGAVGAVGVANTTQAYIEDVATGDGADDDARAAKGTRVNVTGGDLAINANDFASTWLVTAGGAGGGAAGVGGSLSVGVNTSTTKAKIGDYAATNASGTTRVEADSTQNVNSVSIAGGGGGSAGVAGALSLSVVASRTEAGIGDHAKVNQNNPGQNVDVQAHDLIITVGAAGSGAGGGAAGVGGSAHATVVLNTTSAYIGDEAEVSATKDVNVEARSEKFMNSATIAGAGGGAAGVAGAVSVISVGSLLDGEAKSGLQVKETDEDGENTGKEMTTQQYADGQTTKSAVGGMLGSSDQSVKTTGVLDDNAGKMALGKHMDTSTADVPLKNTQAFIGYGAKVDAGEDIKVAAEDKTLAIVVAGTGAGGGAAGVAGAMGVVLLHDSAEAFIADGAKVDAKLDLSVEAHTSDDVYNVAITGSGAGAADVSGTLAVNVVTSDTAAYVGDADINKRLSDTEGQSVSVNAGSATTLVTAAGSGGGAGAASVGGIATTNVLSKTTKAYLANGADVRATDAVSASATSRENVISGAISIRGAGAAAVSGAVSANVVDNTTEAFIGTGAVVDSDGNAKLEASDDTLIVSASAVGNGAGAAAVGGNAVANVISSRTRAYVSDHATVNARGNAEGMSVLDGGVGSGAGTLPSVPGGQSGSLDFNNDGKEDGNLSQGASFNLTDGNGDTQNTSDGVNGKSASAASGGLAEQTRTTGAKGLAITATANEKIVSTTLSVAGSGAASVTGSASASVVKSETSATIGDGVKVNDGSKPVGDPSVRLTAADNTLLVQVGGTISGSGVAAVSGAADVGVITKKTSAHIGDSDVKARNVAIEAISGESLYTIGANVSIAGAAGVGGTVGVDVIKNETTSSIGAGADIDATGDLSVKAEEDAAMDLYTVSGTGGFVGVSGALAVGVIDNTTKAYVEGDSVPAEATVLEVAGNTDIAASSSQDINTVTVSASGGAVGIAGGVAVKVLKSETAAYIGENTQVNPTIGTSTQNVKVSAKDVSTLTGVTGGGAVGAYAVGAVADINIARNTTTAYVGDGAHVNAGGDVDVEATSTKDVQASAIAASGGLSGSIAGSVSLAIVGAELDGTSQESIGSGKTAGQSDGQETVSDQLGDSDHLKGMKKDVADTKDVTKVSGDLNQVSTDSLDKTRAYIGKGAHVTTGDAIGVSATDKTDLDLLATSVAVGSVGLGGAVGVGLSNSTTEAFIDSSSIIDANGNVTVHAKAENLDADGSTVQSIAGAGGIVGATAVVAVMKDTSHTEASIGSDADIQDAAILTVKADTLRKSATEAIGTTVGGLAIGASISRTIFEGETFSSMGPRVHAQVDGLDLLADDSSTAAAKAVAGSAGILSGSGADAEATVSTTVDAHTDEAVHITANNNASIQATGKASTSATAWGVNAGLAAVGVSNSSASVTSDVTAQIGENNIVQADHLFLTASTALPTGGVTASSDSKAASGGLIGINGALSHADYSGSTKSHVGKGSTIIGSASLTATTDTKQTASSSGIAVGGLIAVGASTASATSISDTEASLGEGISMTGDALSIAANGTDQNEADAVAGSGGLIAGAASSAKTETKGSTRALVGDGSPSKSLIVGDFDLSSQHMSKFNARTDSINASLVGASGARSDNEVSYSVQSGIGQNTVIKALSIDVDTINRARKEWLSGGRYNVEAGSGGLLGAAAARSETDIALANETTVGSNADLEVIGDRFNNPGSLRMDGFNEVVAYDRAKLDSGGAIALAKADSVIRNQDDATTQNQTVIQIGSGASLESVGNISLATRTNVDVQSSANAKTYGAAGAAEGVSESTVVTENGVEIQNGVSMLAYGDINLRAGSNSSGNTNQSTVLANTDLWNKTAFPVETKPEANAYLNQSDTITLGSGSQLSSAGNMRLLTERGDSTVKGYGVGKDLYREVLAAIGSFFSNLFGGGDVSLDIKGGSSTNLATTGVTVNGQVNVGINNKQYLFIKSDGSLDASKTSEGITVTKSNENLSNSIQDRIDELDALITQMENQTGTASTSTNPQAQAEIDNLNDEKTGKNSAYTALGSQITQANNQNLANQQTIDSNNTNIQSWQATLDGLDKDASNYAAQKAYYEGLISDAQAQNLTLQGVITTNNTVNIPDWTQRRTDILARIGQIDQRIAQLQATLGTDDGGTGVAGLLQKYQAEKAMLEFQLAGLGDTSNVGVIKVDKEIVARSSNIYVKADNLTGTGALHAPGDTLIEITNESANFLRTNKMTIPDEAGGKIYYNNVPVSSVEAINARNTSQVAGFSNANIVTSDTMTPKISVISSYIPYGSERAPDVFIDGDIRNLNGLVEVTNSFGSVLVKDGVDIVADTISLSAGRDITIGYKDGFRNVAGDVEQDWSSVISASEAGGVDRKDYRTPEEILGITGDQDPSILAGNNVFIAGQYLNINGIVQSGLPLRSLSIPASLAAEIAAYKAKYDAKDPSATERIYKGLSINSGITSDISKVAVFYDAQDDVLELAPVTIMGGYMELYGHVMNTGTGELRVMDGYGTIDVKNDTSYQLRVKTMNTGNGIEGTIKITDTAKSTSTPGTPLVTVIKRLGNDIKSFNNYYGSLDMGTAVSSTTGRSSAYNPLENQYYSWTTLDRATWNESQNYYRERWFGFTTSTEYSWGGSYGIVRQPQVRISAAVPRVIPGHTESYWYDRTYYLNYSGWSSNYEWYNDVWALLYIKDHQVYTRSASEVILHNHNIAAFNPIKINFLGNDTGTLSVNSVGGLIIDGQIKNTAGTTSLVSTTGSILRGTSEESRVIAQSLGLNAAAGIGTISSPVSISLVNSGVLNANTTSGGLNVENPSGSIVYGTIRTGNGDVMLRGDSGITGATSGSLITGNLVSLAAEHGGIGTSSAPVKVDTLAETTGGLSALAASDVFITEQSGDLYLVKAESTGGDVSVSAPGGRILDNNSQQTRDTRAEDKLAALYDDMLLKGDKAQESADATVRAFELGKERGYATYWKYRVRQQDASGKPLASDTYHADAQICLTAAERAYYETTLKWSGSEIQALETKMTSEFHALHASYGAIGNSYLTSWTYTVERPVDGSGKTLYDSTQYDASRYREWDTLIAGHSWTQSQLENSISAGTLKEVSDTETRIEDPNAKGRNITLSAGGAIGHDTTPITITLAPGESWADLTRDEKVALMAAERDDIEVVSATEVKITQREDVDIEATGTLAAQSVGNAYLGSEQDIHIAGINTGGGNLRLKTQQGIDAALPGTAITGRDAILEAGDQSIGASATDPLVVALSGNLTARAGDSLFIRQAAGDMQLNNLYAVHDIHLDSPGSILATNGTPALDIRSENLFLTAQGSIGTSGNALDVGLDATGALTAEAGADTYLNSPSRGLRIARLTSGGEAVITSQVGTLDRASTSLTIDGAVTALDGITIATGGRTVLSTQADVHSTSGDSVLQADTLTMEDDGQEAARFRSDTGTLAVETQGDAIITGIESGNATAQAVAVTSFAGRILDGGDTRLDVIADTKPAAKLTLDAAFGVGADNPLEVRVLDLNASSGGGIGITAEGPVNVEALSASDHISLTATGAITGGSITSTGTGAGADQSVSVISIGDSVDLASVSGRTNVSIQGGTDVTIGTVTGDSVTISAPGAVTVSGNTVNVGSFLQLVGDRIQAGVVGGSRVIGGSIGGFNGGIASNINLTLSSPSGFAFTNFRAINANVNIPQGWISSANTLIGNRAVFTNPVTLMLVDQFKRRVQPCDVQLYSGLSPFAFKLAGNRVDTDAFVIYRDPYHETITPSGNNRSVVEQSGDALAQSQAGQGKKKKRGGEGSGDALSNSLITYAGFPVSLEGE